MSHFTVLVIGEDPEKQLIPYQENNMDDCPKEYLEFHDIEEEYKKKYEEESSECGEYNKVIVSMYDDRFKIPSKNLLENNEYEIVSPWVKRLVPHKERFKSFELFMKEYCGYKEKDELMNKYGYWENPNAKWDWYSLGGRWTGFFKIKLGAEGAIGKPGILTNAPQKGYCDQLRFYELDLEGMRKDKVNEASDRFDKMMKVIGDRPLPPKWKDMLKNYGEENIEKAREDYSNNETVIALRKAKIEFWNEDYWEHFKDFNKEEFIKDARENCLVTFAILIDGKWYERGEMGWWGIVTNEKEDDKWCQEFSKVLDGLTPNTLLSFYDCHI